MCEGHFRLRFALNVGGLVRIGFDEQVMLVISQSKHLKAKLKRMEVKIDWKICV